MSPMASYIGLLKSRFDGSAVASVATAVDMEEAAVEEETLPRWNSDGGKTYENKWAYNLPKLDRNTAVQELPKRKILYYVYVVHRKLHWG